MADVLEALSALRDGWLGSSGLLDGGAGGEEPPPVGEDALRALLAERREGAR